MNRRGNNRCETTKTTSALFTTLLYAARLAVDEFADERDFAFVPKDVTTAIARLGSLRHRSPSGNLRMTGMHPLCLWKLLGRLQKML